MFSLGHTEGELARLCIQTSLTSLDFRRLGLPLLFYHHNIQYNLAELSLCVYCSLFLLRNSVLLGYLIPRELMLFF